MSYLGRTPFSYGFTKLDTPAFNGVLTSFPITKGGIAFAPGNAMGLLISVAGVIQEPFVDFNVSNSTITFNAAHATGVKFFGVSFANQYAIGTIADSTVSTAKLQDGSVTNAKIAEAITISNGGTGGTSAATARTNLGLGSAALLTAGTAANNAVQLTAAAKLPAVDGSLLTGLPSSYSQMVSISANSSANDLAGGTGQRFRIRVNTTQSGDFWTSNGANATGSGSFLLSVVGSSCTVDLYQNTTAYLQQTLNFPSTGTYLVFVSATVSTYATNYSNTITAFAIRTA